MRLFIALPFHHRIRRELLPVQKQLQKNALRGTFTAAGNLHLTLAFLGEVEQAHIPAAFAALEAAAIPPLELMFRELDCFDGGIWYVRPAPCPALMEGQSRLAETLELHNFTLEPRPYIPHLTLGRKIALQPGYTPPRILPHPISAPSEGPRLFLSHRVEGELRYDILTP